MMQRQSIFIWTLGSLYTYFRCGDALLRHWWTWKESSRSLAWGSGSPGPLPDFFCSPFSQGFMLIWFYSSHMLTHQFFCGSSSNPASFNFASRAWIFPSRVLFLASKVCYFGTLWRISSTASSRVLIPAFVWYESKTCLASSSTMTLALFLPLPIRFITSMLTSTSKNLKCLPQKPLSLNDYVLRLKEPIS